MRKSIKRVCAVTLAASMAVAMTACGSSSSSSKPTSSNSGSSDETKAPDANVDETKENGGDNNESSGPRKIRIGSWWVQYYDSTHTSVEDDPSYSGDLAADMKFENVKKIEEKYNCTFEWVNLTYGGVQESINNSIIAGTPDCDIYLVNLGMAIPASMNGLCTDLKEILPEDNDLFTDKVNINYVDLGDGKATILKPVNAEDVVKATYPLAFNKQMLEDNNLEDPRELYKRGEWTWDKFNEYCKVLTQDTDGDKKTDQFGFAGFHQELFEGLMMSNGANVAAGDKETLSSDAIGEVLKEMQEMYTVNNVAYPYDPEDPAPWDTMRFYYRNGNIGFWPSACWIAAQNADYDQNGETGATLDFDTVYVQWPVGPSGNQETNKGKVSDGDYYIIPAGIKDPELVYNVLYDMWNWYDGDTSIRDNEEALAWWHVSTGKVEEIQESNYNVMYDLGLRETFDVWNKVNVGYDFMSLINGDVTPAQFQETYKQQVQDALDAYFH